MGYSFYKETKNGAKKERRRTPRVLPRQQDDDGVNETVLGGAPARPRYSFYQQQRDRKREIFGRALESTVASKSELKRRFEQYKSSTDGRQRRRRVVCFRVRGDDGNRSNSPPGQPTAYKEDLPSVR